MHLIIHNPGQLLCRVQVGQVGEECFPNGLLGGDNDDGRVGGGSVAGPRDGAVSEGLGRSVTSVWSALSGTMTTVVPRYFTDFG